MNRLFIGGMSHTTTCDDIRRAFERFGVIQAVNIIRHDVSGHSRGFGFVSFADTASADAARAAMDGAMLDGQIVRVDDAASKLR